MNCSNTIPPYNPYISPQYLQELHKMDYHEAELYCLFCQKHTIRFKECYGNGEIMLPLWEEFNKDADKAIGDLLKV